MVTDEMRREVAAKLRDIGDDDGMAEAWRLRNAISGSGFCEKGMANVALMADYVDRPPCRNEADDYIGTNFKCSQCGHFRELGHDFNYCPHCGAEVVG